MSNSGLIQIQQNVRNKIIKDEKTFNNIKKNLDLDIKNIKNFKLTLTKLPKVNDTNFIKECYRSIYINLTSCLDYYTTEIIICGLFEIAKGNKNPGKTYKDLKISIQVLDSIEQNFNDSTMRETVFDFIKTGIRDEVYKNSYQKWTNRIE